LKFFLDATAEERSRRRALETGRPHGEEAASMETRDREDSTREIAPLRIARGVQNKVLEGMASGRAVVCSPVAAEGIDAVNDRDPTDSPAVGSLLTDSAQLRLGHLAVRLVLELHDGPPAVCAPRGTQESRYRSRVGVPHVVQ
jgi:hypothetical protein